MNRNKCFRNVKGTLVFWLGSIIPYLYIKHLLTYYDFLRILLRIYIYSPLTNYLEQLYRKLA